VTGSHCCSLWGHEIYVLVSYVLYSDEIVLKQQDNNVEEDDDVLRNV